MESLNNIDKSAILALIEKYEDKIAAIKMLQSQPIDRCMASELNRMSEERLKTRLYERNTFLDDLKSLLNNK